VTYLIDATAWVAVVGPVPLTDAVPGPGRLAIAIIAVLALGPVAVYGRRR
jgi:hypothetical protein